MSYKGVKKENLNFKPYIGNILKMKVDGVWKKSFNEVKQSSKRSQKCREEKEGHYDNGESRKEGQKSKFGLQLQSIRRVGSVESYFSVDPSQEQRSFIQGEAKNKIPNVYLRQNKSTKNCDASVNSLLQDKQNLNPNALHTKKILSKRVSNSSLICLSDRINVEVNKNNRKLSTNLQDKSQKSFVKSSQKNKKSREKTQIQKKCNNIKEREKKNQNKVGQIKINKGFQKQQSKMYKKCITPFYNKKLNTAQRVETNKDRYNFFQKKASLFTWLSLIRKLFQQKFQQRQCTRLKKQEIIEYLLSISQMVLQQQNNINFIGYQTQVYLRDIATTLQILAKRAAEEGKVSKKDKHGLTIHQVQQGLLGQHNDENEVETARFQEQELQQRKRKKQFQRQNQSLCYGLRPFPKDSNEQSLQSSLLQSKDSFKQSQNRTQLNNFVVARPNEHENAASNFRNQPSTRDSLAEILKKERRCRSSLFQSIRLEQVTEEAQVPQPNQSVAHLSNQNLKKQILNRSLFAGQAATHSLLHRASAKNNAQKEDSLHSSHLMRSRQSLAPSLAPFSLHFSRQESLLLQHEPFELQDSFPRSSNTLALQDLLHRLQLLSLQLEADNARQEQLHVLSQILNYGIHMRRNKQINTEEQAFYTLCICIGDNVSLFKNGLVQEFIQRLEGVNIRLGRANIENNVFNIFCHQRIKILNLSRNNLSKLHFKLHSVEFLNLNYNCFTSIQSLLQYKQLKQLHISHNKISAALDEYYCKRNESTAVILSFSKKANKNKDPLLQLTLIDLSFNLLQREQDIQLLYKCPKLKIINIHENAFTRAHSQQGILLYDYADISPMSQYIQYREVAFETAII